MPSTRAPHEVRRTGRTGLGRRGAALAGVVIALTAVVAVAAGPAGATGVAAALTTNVVATGQHLDVHGTVSPATDGARVAVERRLPGNVWSTRAVGTTNATGAYTIALAPTGSGIYALRIRSRVGYSPIFYLRVLGPLVLDRGGLGTLRLGMTLAQAEATHWVRGTSAGCELSGESAAVFPPGVQVEASFFQGHLFNISLSSRGATAEGATIGGTQASLGRIYPAPTWTVDVDTSSVAMFGVRLIVVSRTGSDGYGISVNPTTNTIDALAVPDTDICE